MKAVSARSASVARGSVLLDHVAVAVGDALDQERLHAQPLVRERGEGGRHLHRASPRPRRARSAGRAAARPRGRAGARTRCPSRCRPPAACARRGCCGSARPPRRSGIGPQKRAVVVLRRPHRAVPRVREAERRVDQDRGGRVAERLERGRVHDRLEGRAHLAHRLGGAVELAALEVVAADHRPHGAGAHVERQQRALHLRLLLELQPALRGGPRPRTARRCGTGAIGARAAARRPGSCAASRRCRRPAAARGSRRSAPRRSRGRRPATTPRTTSPSRERPVPLVEVQRLRQQAVRPEHARLGRHEAARAPVERAQPVAQRAHRGALRRRVERRVDAQAALVDALAAVLLLEVLAHLLEEVGAIEGGSRCRCRPSGSRLGGVRLLAA